jgi:Ca-activated chloride channel family protein
VIAFEQPGVLGIAAALPLFAAYLLISRKRGKRGTSLPLQPWKGNAPADAGLPWRMAYALSLLAGALGWLCIAAAAAGPALVVQRELSSYSDLDIIFTLDVSPSMAAMDIEPTRLEGAVTILRTLLPSGAADGGAGSLRGAALGLVGFGANAALLCPPTTDYESFDGALGLLKPGLLGDGTAVGQGLALALRHALAGAGGKKAIVLITDGEDNAGVIHPLDGAALMKRSGVSLIVLGIGSKGDAPIEYVNPSTGERLTGSYRSSFNDASLMAIAAEANGLYAAAPDASSLERALERVASVAGLEPRPLPLLHAERVPLAALCTALGMIALALAWAIRRLIFGGVA